MSDKTQTSATASRRSIKGKTTPISSANKKALAEDLFMRGMTGEQIVDWFDRSGIKTNTTTVSRWRQAEGWDDKRKARTLGRDKLVSSLIQQQLKIIQVAEQDDRPMTPAETDQVMKLTKSIETLDQRLTPQMAVDAFEEFIRFLESSAGKDSLELQKLLTPKYREFIIHLIQV